MRRRFTAIRVSLACGAAVVIVAPFVLERTWPWVEWETWFAVMVTSWKPLLEFLSFLGPVNAVVGVRDGLLSDARRQRPVAVVPLLLFLYPAAHYMQKPGASHQWEAALFGICLVAPFVWVAGQVGQEVSIAIRQMLTGAAGQANGPNA